MMQTPQHPLPSGFGPASTTADVIKGIDLHGKVAIVTGGYSGLGREAVRTLLGAGAHVIVPARDLPRAQAALQGIDGVEIAPMDLLDPHSIDAFAEDFLAGGRPLHILINNAAIMACPLERDARGYEAQFATNHLGHFQLTARLWPALLKAQGARVVNVSSRGHRFSPVVLEDPNFEHRPYDPWQGYGQSKTANILFSVELDKRGRASGVRSFSVHPGGIVATNLGKHITREMLQQFGAVDAEGKPIIDPANGLKTPEQGASTIVWCATSPQLDGLGGVYCEDTDIASLNTNESQQVSRDVTTLRGVRDYAVDPNNARQLWELSEKLLGLRF